MLRRISCKTASRTVVRRLNGGMSTTSESGRKIVCNPCRARKKRCDGQRPVCSSCRDRRVRCRYPSPSTSLQSTGDVEFVHMGLNATPTSAMTFGPLPQPSSMDPPTFEFNDAFRSSDTFPSLAFDINSEVQPVFSWDAEGEQNSTIWEPGWLGGFPNQHYDIGTPFNGLLTHSPEPNAPTTGASLPDQNKLAELIDVYFRRVHHFLPILHRSTLQDSVEKPGAKDHLSPLIFAVVSLATCERQDSSAMDTRVRWYREAKRQYALSEHVPAHPITTLQAAVCLIFQGMIINDFDSAWLTLGKAWRQVVALGYHRLDSDHGKAMPSAPPLPQDWIQQESIRRIVWTLYILDRGLCFPVGLVHNIEDKYVNINLPMAEDLFQQSIRHDNATAIRFTPCFEKLLHSVRQTAIRTKRENRLNYIIVGYMLLGHIVAHFHYSDDLDHSEKEASFHHLESCLVKLRLCLPRSATSLSAAPFEDLRSIAWLNVVLNINTIFLYQGKDADVKNNEATHWHHCLTAARNIVAFIREAGSISTDLLLNPHTASPLFCSSRILIIEYLVPNQLGDASGRETDEHLTVMCDQAVSLISQASESPVKDPSLKQDLDLTILVFEQLAEAFGPIGMKFKKGVMYDLDQDVEVAAQLKRNGIKDIMSRCASWGAGPPSFGASV